MTSFAVINAPLAPIIRGDSLYQLVRTDSPDEWISLRLQSQALGGDLVKFETQQENSFVVDQYKGVVPTINIGLLRVDLNAFAWVDGEVLTESSYTNWGIWRNNVPPIVEPVNPEFDYVLMSMPGGDIPNVGVAPSEWFAGPGAWNSKWTPDIDAAGVAEIPLNLFITSSNAPIEGLGVFTTSINLYAGSESSGNLAEGAEVFWSISGITSDDLASGALEGSGVITNGVLEIEHSLVEDNDTGESFDVSVFSDAERTQQIGETEEFAIAGEIPTQAGSAPSLYKATVNGNQVTLQFNEELATTLPSLGKFEFNSGVKTYRAIDASVNDADGTVVLTLNAPVQAGRALQMSYFDLSFDQKKNVIQSTTGVDWSRQESLNIENRTIEDLQLTVEDAEFNGNQIQIYLDGPTADTLPSLRRFKVQAGKKRQRVTDVDIDAAEGVVTLTTQKDLSLYESISISYKDLKRDQLSGVIEDEFGNDMKTFKGYEVLNPNYVDEPPSLVNLEYDDGEITIEFDSVLDFGKVNKRRFKVSADGRRLRVESAVVESEGDSFVVLQTATKRNQSIDLETDMRLSYWDPRGDQGRNVIEDLFGNDVPSFAEQIVTVI